MGQVIHDCDVVQQFSDTMRYRRVVLGLEDANSGTLKRADGSEIQLADQFVARCKAVWAVANNDTTGGPGTQAQAAFGVSGDGALYTLDPGTPTIDDVTVSVTAGGVLRFTVDLGPAWDGNHTMVVELYEAIAN